MEIQPNHKMIIDFLLQNLQKYKDLPSWFFEALKNEEIFIEEKHSSNSYISFLEQQISLMPRGKEWNEVLEKRKNYIEKNPTYYFCRVSDGDFDISVMFNMDSNSILVEL